MQRVFVVGCGRSGTTLLQALLGAHPKIVTFPETQWFADNLGEWERRVLGRTLSTSRLPVRYSLARLRASLGLATARARSGWSRVAPHICTGNRLPLLGISVRLNLLHFLEAADQFAARKGASTWLEKSPNHVFYVRDVLRIAPAARFIHVVRDGLAVVASTVDAARKYPDSTWANFQDPLDAAERWNSAIRATMQFQRDPSHLIVRYDDLVGDPRSTLTRCFAFLELPDYREAVLHYGKAMPSIAQPREAWKASAGAPIAFRKSKADDLFSPEDQARISAALLFGGNPPF